MATEFFLKLWDNHIIQLGVWQTVYMTFLTSLFAYVIGLPLGVVLWVTDKDGLHPNKGVNTVLGFIVNFFRSIPAVILMVAMIPAARLLLGTSTGNGAVIVTLIIAAAPYVARMVESSLKEVPAGVIEAAQAMGCTNLQMKSGGGVPHRCHTDHMDTVAHLRLDHLHGHDPQLYRPRRHTRRHRPRPGRHHLRPPEKPEARRLGLRVPDRHHRAGHPDRRHAHPPQDG